MLTSFGFTRQQSHNVRIPRMQHRHLLPGLGLATALLLAACGGPPRHGEHVDRTPDAQAVQRAQALADSGYHARESSTLTLALQQWAVAGTAMPVSLAFPGQGTKLPLIVYVPGLGESAQAGSRWRQAWARAGYAVLSAQPLEFDASAWSSDLARGAEFKALAREHLKPELQPERMRHLQALLEEARRRALSGDSLWSRVDFDRIAFAGYDFGSLSAAAPRSAATLLLSPLPLDAAAAAAMDRPLLMVGSQRDVDVIGAVAAPQDRVQAFDSLPPGNKALLMLDGASHALLSGNVGQEGGDEDRAESAPPARSRNGQGGQGGQGSGGRRSRNGGGMGGNNNNGGQAAGRDAGSYGGANASAGGRGSWAGLMQAQAVETLSIAFFDAHLRGSKEARQWLDRDAANWLGELGEWQQR